MTFEHDFGYSFPLFYSLLKKEGEKYENELAKIIIKFRSNAFLLDLSKDPKKNKTFLFFGAFLGCFVMFLSFFFYEFVEQFK